MKSNAIIMLSVACVIGATLTLVVSSPQSNPLPKGQNSVDYKVLDMIPIVSKKNPTTDETQNEKGSVSVLQLELFDPIEETAAVQAESDAEDLPYTEEELDILSRVINGEYGMDWASDETQQLVGLVVMNRVGHHLFPDTIKDVVFAPGQYACTWDGNYDKQPSEKSIENARKVLSGQADIECPSNVVFQSGVPQGDGTFLETYDEVLNVTTYFCYTNK